MNAPPRATLEWLLAHAKQLGYTVRVDPDGTERVYRPDGSLAITAKPQRAAEPPQAP